ncbi:MAG: hypothetical protein JSV16_02045, partial [Candidatus Hydrogenedentota bacterium]
GLVQLVKDTVTNKETFAKITLDVSPANNSAIRVYEKSGFKKISPSNQVGKRWIMVCELSQF